MSSSTSNLTILTARDVDKVLSLPATVDKAMESQAEVFRTFSALPVTSSDHPTDVQMPDRIATATEGHAILYMPSRIKTAGGTGIKIVSVPTRGGEDGLPASTLIIDDSTGKVSGIINARRLTALRNACGSALFLRTVQSPRGPPKAVVIFGSGLQSRTHAEVLLRTFETISKVTIVGRKETQRLESCVQALQNSFPRVEISAGIAAAPGDGANLPATEAATSIEEEDFEVIDKADSSAGTVFNLSQAIHNADVVITCTPSAVPLFNHVDVTSQSHIIMIGSYTPAMHEVDVELVHRAGVVVVDSARGCAREAGELIDAGLTDPTDERLVELGCLLADGGEVSLDRVKTNGDVFMYKSVGIGIQDVSIASFVLDEASKLGLGTVIQGYD